MAAHTILSLWNAFVTVQLLMLGDPECSAKGYNNNNIPSFCCSVSSSALFARTASSRTREVAAGRLGTVSANFSMYWNAPLKHDKLTTWQQADWELSQLTFLCTETLLWNMTNWQHGSRQTGNNLCKLFHVLKRSSETWQIDNVAADRLGTVSANFSMSQNTPLKHDRTDNNVPAFFPCISSDTCHSSRQKRTTTGESETA